MDVHKIGLLDCRGNILEEGLLYYRHFMGETHCFGVCDALVPVHVGGGAVWNDEWTQVSQVYEGYVRNERT